MTSFDQTLARLLLEICRYTYAAAFSSSASNNEKQDALNWINQAGIPDSIEMINIASSSVACVVSYPDKIIVSYMGTKTEFNTPDEIKASIDDWYKNANALLVPFSLTTDQLGVDHLDKGNLGGRVHSGFLDELGAVQAKVIQELMKRGGKDKPVYITGHSQGGAVAVLATRALLAGNFPINAIYTFAAARPGDLAFAQSIPETLPFHRIEFGDDIVPHLPPAHINKNVRFFITMSMKALTLSSRLLPKLAQRLLVFLQNTSAKTEFESAGKLSYGSHATKELRIDISAELEAELFYTRLTRLIYHPQNWAEHHHLAGTTLEVSNGEKGNYTALISEFPIVN